MRDYGEWAGLAACRNCGPSGFFDRSRDDEEAMRAKRICQIDCSVKSDCLTHAVIYKEAAGVWGGYTESERRYIRPTIRRRLMRLAIIEGRIDSRLIKDPEGIEMYQDLLRELRDQGLIPRKLVSNTGTYNGPMAA
jgi:WhiB family redox-sensing transcriptional regulator